MSVLNKPKLTLLYTDGNKHTLQVDNSVYELILRPASFCMRIVKSNPAESFTVEHMQEINKFVGEKVNIGNYLQQQGPIA